MNKVTVIDKSQETYSSLKQGELFIFTEALPDSVCVNEICIKSSGEYVYLNTGTNGYSAKPDTPIKRIKTSVTITPGEPL